MHVAKSDIPLRIDAPGAQARQTAVLGETSGYGALAGEYFSLAAGTDVSPLLKGLKDNLCQAPHWGYLLRGEITVRYVDGPEEVVREGELFYLPAGHTVRVGRDAELIMFSPRKEHGDVIDHMRRKLMS